MWLKIPLSISNCFSFLKIQFRLCSKYLITHASSRRCVWTLAYILFPLSDGGFCCGVLVLHKIVRRFDISASNNITSPTVFVLIRRTSEKKQKQNKTKQKQKQKN